MDFVRPRVRETRIRGDLSVNRRWSRLTTRIFCFLAEGMPKTHLRKLSLDIRRALRSGSGFGTYFIRISANNIEAHIRGVKIALEHAEKKSSAEILLLYRDHWLAFMWKLQILTEIGRHLELEHLKSKLINVSINHWIDVIVLKKNGALLSHMIKILAQRIFEDEFDPEQVDLTYKIVRSFDTMHSAARMKAFNRFKYFFQDRILHRAFEEYVKKSLARTTCRKTLGKIDEWKRAVIETTDELNFVDQARVALEIIITSCVSELIFEKAAQEMSHKYKLFRETHTASEMPSTTIAPEIALKMLWGADHFLKRGVPSELRRMKKNYKHLEFICGRGESSTLAFKWEAQAAKQLRSEILRFPTDPLQRITDSRAFVDFYCEAWNAHCRYASFHMMLLSRVTPYMDGYTFFARCLTDWAQQVVAVERKCIHHHFGVLLREHLTDLMMSAVPNYRHGVFTKLTTIALSLRYLGMEELERLRIYCITHVMKPFAEAVAEELKKELTPLNCVAVIQRLLKRVTSVQRELFFRKPFNEFNRRLRRIYLEFASSIITDLLMEKHALAINKLCSLIDTYESPERTKFLEKISIQCEEEGRKTIQECDEREAGCDFPRAVLCASQEFDMLVKEMSSKKVQTAVLKGYQSAIDKEAKSRGFSALELLTEVFMPGANRTAELGLQTERGIFKMTIYVELFKYFSNLEQFSELYTDSFRKRAMSTSRFSSEVESAVLPLVCKLLDKTHVGNYKHQCADLIRSVERVRLLPPAFGFKKTEAPRNVEEANSKGDRHVNYKEASQRRLRKKTCSDEAPDGILTFGDVEFIVRLLRDRVWPIKRLRTEFTPPLILERIMSSFEKIFKMEEGNRRLTWLPHVSRVNMLWRFTRDQRAYHVECDSFAAAVMLRFEDCDEVTLEAIQDGTKISASLLRCLIAVLLESNILVPRGSIDGNTLALNLDFQSSSNELHFEIPYQEESELIDEDTPKKAAQKATDCVWGCAAAMARVAKRASSISKRDLLQQTVWELGEKGCPDPAHLHEALDHLVRHFYVEYDNVTKMFIYVP